MKSDLTIDLPAFYTEIARLLKAKYDYDRGYNKEYGERRQKDSHYAVNIVGFEAISVGNKTCGIVGSDAPVPYTHIYNRKGAKPDLQYLIAPDTRVPNYSTSLSDSIELANIIGLKILNIPKWPCDAKDNFLGQILAACDAVIGSE